MSVINVDILWFIEHDARELDVACCIKAWHDLHNGLSITILPIYSDNFNQLVSNYAPRVIAVQSANFPDAPEQPIYTLRKIFPNAVFLNLAFEQFLNRINLAFRAPQSQFEREIVIHHAWGKFFQDYLISHGVNPKNIRLNGHPAYGLYRPPYHQILPSKEQLAAQFGLNQDKRWIFFPENYWWAFVSDQRANAYIRQGMSANIVRKRRQHDTKSVKRVIQWIDTVVRKHATLQFIIRPRPAIKTDDYIQKYVDVMGAIPDNILITQDLSVREWVTTSDMVISSVSTVLLESAVLKKSAYILEPYTLLDVSYSDWFEHFPHLHSAEAFESACLSPEMNPKHQQAQAYVEASAFYNPDPLLGLANLLSDMISAQPQHQQPLTPPPPPHKKPTFRNQFRYYIKRSIDYLDAWRYRTPVRKYNETRNNAPSRKVTETSPEKVAKMLTKWNIFWNNLKTN